MDQQEHQQQERQVMPKLEISLGYVNISPTLSDNLRYIYAIMYLWIGKATNSILTILQ